MTKYDVCDWCWKENYEVFGFPYSSFRFKNKDPIGTNQFNFPIGLFEDDEELFYIVLSMSNSINLVTYNPFGDILDSIYRL